MVLNKKQKLYLFTAILDNESKVKIFETTDLNWLCKQKAKIGNKDDFGWRPLIINGEQITLLNFAQNPDWDEVLNDIDNWEQCQWCKEWFPCDEIIFAKKGFTKLCHHCKDYLISREGEC